MPNYPPLKLINEAVFERLNGDVTLAGLVEEIVNDEAQDQTHPFVLIPACSARPWNTMGLSYGWDCELDATVYSHAETDIEAMLIAERIVALLNDHQLSIAGYSTVLCELDPDGSPPPIKIKVEGKKDRRALTNRFCIKVHE